jgi:hypothetical protein
MRTFSSMSQPDLKLTMEAFECLQKSLEDKSKEMNSSDAPSSASKDIRDADLINSKLIRVKELIQAIDQEIIEY